MTPVRSNRNLIIIIAVISVVALIYGITNFKRALPEIAINFEVSKKEALATAHQYLSDRDFDLNGFRRTISFQISGLAKYYMEREVGVKRTISLAKDSIDVWYWRARFFKELEELEYSVRIAPDGRVISFNRKLPETVPGDSLDADSARILATEFITESLGLGIDRWEEVEAKSYDRPNRTDHEFEYELKDFKVAEAPYRLIVEVQGDKVSFFKRYLKVPQEWRREFSRQRSKNDLLGMIAYFFFFLLAIGMFVHFFKNVRKHQIPWKAAFWIGSALGVAHFIMGLNSIPLAMNGYNTTSSFIAFIGKQILESVIAGLAQGVLLLIAFSAAEYLYRQDNPDKLFIPRIFSRKGFHTLEFMQATIVGYLMAAFAVGYVVFYYILGSKIGFWSPANIKYTELVSTALPWIYPLAISMGASLLEEFIFRVFGIFFLRRLFKSTWAAVLVSAMIWAFLHSGYPQQPSFARGIELTIEGVIIGVLMLRFGVWAALTYHFVYDAVMIGLFLFQSSNAYFWISGLIVCGCLAIPAVIAGVAYIRRRSFYPGEELLNRAFEKPQISIETPVETKIEVTPVKVDAPQYIYTPLSSSIRRAIIVIGLAGIIIGLLPVPGQIRDGTKPLIDRKEAIKIASDELKKRYNKDPDQYKIVVRHSSFRKKVKSSPSTGTTYIKKHGSVEDYKRIIWEPDGPHFGYWNVWFKRELDPEYFHFSIKKSTNEVKPHHSLADTTSGANLDTDSALALATEEFQRIQPDHELYHLIKSRSEKKDNRTDHFFTWETSEPILAEAHYRQWVSLIGDEIESSWRYIQEPEEWNRHEKEKNLRSMLLNVSMIVLIIAFLVFGVIKLIKQLTQHQVRWRTGMIVGSLAFIVYLLAQWNEWAVFWMDYYTAKPMADYITSQLLAKAMGTVTIGLFIMLLISFVGSFVRDRYSTSPWLGLAGNNRSVVGDGLLVMVGVIGVSVGLPWLMNAISVWFNLPEHLFNLTRTAQYKYASSISLYLPFYGVISDAVIDAIRSGVIVLIAFMLIESFFKRSWLRWLILVAVAFAVSGAKLEAIGNLTAGEFSWHFIKMLVYVVAGYMVLKHWVGGRLWALIAALMITRLIAAGLTFVGWGDSPYYIDGWVLIVISALLIAHPLIRMFRMKPA